ncbi:MAG: KamA family radical SAM protein [Desulfobacterales bacterium]|nr:KamA family radical SAM protein [Desulfobacterales bacterium]
MTPHLQKPSDHGSDWHEILSRCVSTGNELAKHLPVQTQTIDQIIARYPMRIPSYYLSLIRSPDDPLGRQAIPSIAELRDTIFPEDPLAEDEQTPVPCLVHRYPDRVLFWVSNQCAMYCRFCMRKRRIGMADTVSEAVMDRAFSYIRDHTKVREVVLSGGDPLLLENDALKRILTTLRKISHVEVIRIHTRTPCTLPQRIERPLTEMLKTFHPVYINIHFNHPDEITPQAARACALLADAGIALGSQSVLLKGVNDDPRTMGRLMRALLRIRVKPYYLHHADPVSSTGHFRTSIQKGLDIMRSLRGHLSGMCVPQYMIDLPEGGGKIPLLPEYVKAMSCGGIIVENYQGRTYRYPAEVHSDSGT